MSACDELDGRPRHQVMRFQAIAPKSAARIVVWVGALTIPPPPVQGLGTAVDTFNATTFEPIKTSKLRLEVNPQKDQPAGVLEWKVYNFGPVPSLRPVIDAGIDRSVVSGGRSDLSGKVTWLQDSPRNVARWQKTSGPGSVAFEDATALITAATFSRTDVHLFDIPVGALAFSSGTYLSQFLSRQTSFIYHQRRMDGNGT